jgi:hypothetical protein
MDPELKQALEERITEAKNAAKKVDYILDMHYELPKFRQSRRITLKQHFPPRTLKYENLEQQILVQVKKNYTSYHYGESSYTARYYANKYSVSVSYKEEKVLEYKVSTEYSGKNPRYSVQSFLPGPWLKYVNKTYDGKKDEAEKLQSEKQEAKEEEFLRKFGIS